MNDRGLIATALAEAAKAINRPRSLDETLEAIVRAAQQTVPGFEHAGISVVHRNGKIETRIGTAPLVWELDALQYEHREGPCFDALHTHDPVLVMEDAETEPRWSRYLPPAREKGLRSQLGLRVYIDDKTIGALNLYSMNPGVDPDAVQVAELFATHAGIALGRARYEHQLSESVSSRQAIGTAVGIVMERYQITEDRAFQFLTRASMAANVKLRLIAQDIVETANEKYAADVDQP